MKKEEDEEDDEEEEEEEGRRRKEEEEEEEEESFYLRSHRHSSLPIFEEVHLRSLMTAGSELNRAPISPCIILMTRRYAFAFCLSSVRSKHIPSGTIHMK